MDNPSSFVVQDGYYSFFAYREELGAMPFPQTPRVLYHKNPLDQVICQLRFPPILRIEAAIPADFQDSIRDAFPGFAESSELKVEMPPEVSDQVPPSILRQMVQPPHLKSFEFASEDGKRKVHLTRTFLALSTSDYHRWETFKEVLKRPLDALIQVYSPQYFVRIGLRYIDIIRRSKLGLSGVPWRELLCPHISAVLGYPGVGENVETQEAMYAVTLDDPSGAVRIRTNFVEAKDDGEICFVIDSDFFTDQKTSLQEAAARLDYFNTRGSRLIRWCITERLHLAMEPEQL
ncbi:hypothetical protein CLG94_00005 [Candidatus Methylomirabilis limnetica]|uniref:TIGR04255 family protein n=2 Tax=Candidatus Methylomirabilis limnetica TaxID=2033718 RepID=A0A2T4U1M6_9BACT|nr:hypothetical protein CLG94_00005 [Candidatus Methylomirabilis limnetica]